MDFANQAISRYTPVYDNKHRMDEMSVEDLTREAVIKAMDEYDKLGRNTFLEKYGFAKPRVFWIDYRDKVYPTKAIAGVAHKFLPPFFEQLYNSEFVGGMDGAAGVIEKLGFTLVKR